MGIQGFLQRLKTTLVEESVDNYANKTVVIDAMSWLHKGCYSCAVELAMERPTKAYIRYMMKNINALRHRNVIPLVVFDGKKLPLKSDTHANRSSTRQDYLVDGKKLYSESFKTGDLKMRRKGENLLQRAVKPSQEMIANVMQVFTENKIQYVVAPYEADAQMAALVSLNKASAIMTEDSDLLVYCAAARLHSCPVLFKFNNSTGTVKSLSLNNLRKQQHPTSDKFLKNLSIILNGEEKDLRMFVQFACLSGCDFLPSLPNMGIVTALNEVVKLRSTPNSERVAKLLRHLKAKVSIPEDYLERFYKAEALFYYHIIYDAVLQKPRYLTSEFPDIASRVCSEFLGELEPNADTAKKLYTGVLNARTLKPTSELVVLPSSNNVRAFPKKTAKKTQGFKITSSSVPKKSLSAATHFSTFQLYKPKSTVVKKVGPDVIDLCDENIPIIVQSQTLNVQNTKVRGSGPNVQNSQVKPRVQSTQVITSKKRKKNHRDNNCNTQLITSFFKKK